MLRYGPWPPILGRVKNISAALSVGSNNWPIAGTGRNGLYFPVTSSNLIQSMPTPLESAPLCLSHTVILVTFSGRVMFLIAKPPPGLSFERFSHFPFVVTPGPYRATRPPDAPLLPSGRAAAPAICAVLRPVPSGLS